MLKSFAGMNPFLLLSRPGLSGKIPLFGSKPNASTGVSGENLFAMMLAGMKSGSGSPGISHAGHSLSFMKNDASVPLSRSGNGEDDQSIAGILESAFLRHGVFPENLKLSQEDLDFLVNVLEDMGVSRFRLAPVFETMKGTHADGLMTLAQFLRDLSAFEQAETQRKDVVPTDATDSLDKSVTPHLELILRNLGIPPEKMNAVLSNASGKTGAIDIEKLVIQLKSYVNSTQENSKPLQGAVLETPSIQRTVSGLEKLGVSIPDKAPHQPLTLEMFIQALEKKIQTTAPVSSSAPMDATRVAEAVLEMPAVKSMKSNKADNYFGYAREMMADKQNKPVRSKTQLPAFESQESKAVTKDTDFRPMQMDGFKQDPEKRLTVLTDGSGRQQSHQALMPGGERVQWPGVSFVHASEELSVPGRPVGASQQGPLPSAVVNQVGKEIAGFLQRGNRIFTLQLKPPELGTVNIEMDVKKNVLKLSVVTETSSARDMLQANYVDLKRVLEGYGVRVESFDVQLNTSLNQASANGDGSLNQQHSFHGRFGKNLHSGKPTGETIGEDDIDSPVSRQPDKDGLIDVLA